jgi:hypothetical protein
MRYENQLPPIRKLKRLAEWDGPFPIKSYRLVLGARRFGFDDDTIRFLRLFPHDSVFNSRDDFIYSCEMLESSIQADRKPAATIHTLPAAKQDIVQVALHFIASAKSSVVGFSTSARDEIWY